MLRCTFQEIASQSREWYLPTTGGPSFSLLLTRVLSESCLSRYMSCDPHLYLYGPYIFLSVLEGLVMDSVTQAGPHWIYYYKSDLVTMGSPRTTQYVTIMCNSVWNAVNVDSPKAFDSVIFNYVIGANETPPVNEWSLRMAVEGHCCEMGYWTMGLWFEGSVNMSVWRHYC